MEKYYMQTKIIMAEPMDHNQFYLLMTQKEEGIDKNRPGYRVRDESGEISWFLKESFNQIHKEIS